MLGDSARLFAPDLKDEPDRSFVKNSVPRTLEKLLNLSILLDAIALHENVYVLKGEVPRESQALLLRQILLEKGIVKVLDTLPFEEQIVKEFSEYLNQISEQARWKAHRYEQTEAQAALLDGISLFMRADFSREPGPTLAYATFYDLATLKEIELPYHGDEKFNSAEVYENPMLLLGRYLVEGFGYSPTDSDPITSQSPLLRTFLYWRVSEHAGVSFYPSARRIAQYELLRTEVAKLVSEDVMKILTENFQEMVSAAYSRDVEVPIKMPPTLAIFLDIYRDTKDLSTSIIRFRQFFAKTRRALAEAEDSLASVRTVGGRQKAVKRIAKTAAALNTDLNRADDIVLKDALEFVPEILKPLSNPLDPTNYSSRLLSRPIEWIRHWWISRPLRPVYNVKSRLSNIAQYQVLLDETLGISVSGSEQVRLIDHYTKYFQLRAEPKE